jgi:hypothetical protein
MRLVEKEEVADSDLLTLERPESRRSKKGPFLGRLAIPMRNWDSRLRSGEDRIVAVPPDTFTYLEGHPGHYSGPSRAKCRRKFPIDPAGCTPV